MMSDIYLNPLKNRMHSYGMQLLRGITFFTVRYSLTGITGVTFFAKRAFTERAFTERGIPNGMRYINKRAFAMALIPVREYRSVKETIIPSTPHPVRNASLGKTRKQTTTRIPLGMLRSVKQENKPQPRIPLGMLRSVKETIIPSTRIPLGMQPHKKPKNEQ